VDFNCVQRCQSIVTTVAVGCGPMVNPKFGGDLGARPMSGSQGLHILGPMWALVLLSDSILDLLPLYF
jgi:hypothetical protein